VAIAAPKRQAKSLLWAGWRFGVFEPPWRTLYQDELKEYPMRFGLSVAVLAAVLSLDAAPVRASICLGKSLSLEETVDAINAEAGCDRAMKRFEACAYGSSGDIHLGAAVEKKCERNFLDRLKEPQRRLYQSKMRLCDRKYQNEEGTMYRSLTAFCRAEVARRFSRQAGKAAPSSPR
jgi:hypothetical protein